MLLQLQRTLKRFELSTIAYGTSKTTKCRLRFTSYTIRAPTLFAPRQLLYLINVIAIQRSTQYAIEI